MVNASNFTTCISLNNQQCMAQSTLIKLDPKDYIKGLNHDPFAVNLDGCTGTCNTINDLFIRICFLNKTKDLNLSVFNLITGINKSKALTKQISCECKCKFDGRKYNSNKNWNNNKRRCQKSE